MFPTEMTWPLYYISDPSDGYVVYDVLGKATGAYNDFYGAFHAYIGDFVRRACERIKTSPVSFTLYNVNAINVPKLLTAQNKMGDGFDRIDVRCFSFTAIAMALTFLQVSTLTEFKRGPIPYELRVEAC